MSQSVIREATRRDIPLLAKLAVETFTETFGHRYSAADLTAHLADKCSEDYFDAAFDFNDTIYLSELEGEAIGYGKLGHVEVPVKPAPEKGGVEFHRVYIRKPFQAMGHGRNLLVSMISNPRAKLAPVTYIGVWEENVAAQGLYAAHGFRKIGDYTYYVGQHADHEIIMARRRG